MNKGFTSITEAKNFFITDTPNKDINLNRLNIGTCPYCNSLQSPGSGIKSITLIHDDKIYNLEVNRTCSNAKCARSFIDTFEVTETDQALNFNKIHTLTYKEMETADFVLYFSRKGEKDVFGRFHNYYAEAIDALNGGMEEAAGMLLRKSLEALMFDYIRFGARIKGNSNKDMQYLEKQGLMKSVEMIEDVALKELAKRAVWIGNDNVHTKKKWNHFDTDDLDRLLGAIVLNIYAKIECLIYLRKMNKR
jgi:hypothetical protein